MYDTSTPFYTPCYHEQPGMTYPHNSDLCDHVPDIEGTCQRLRFYGQNYSYNSDCIQNNTQNCGHFYNEDNHSCDAQSYNQCFTTTNYDSQPMFPSDSGQFPDSYIIAEEDREPVKRIYEEISAECEHLLLKKNCEECRFKPMSNEQSSDSQNDKSSPSTEMVSNKSNADCHVVDEETTQLALSMVRKREQNKMAAARYREKKKTQLHSTKAEVQKLEKRNLDLKNVVAGYQNEINDLRKKLGLPIS